MNAREWLLVCSSLWIGAFGGFPAIALGLHARLIRRLKTNQYMLWVDLGSPTLWQVAMTGGVPFGGGNFRYGSGANKYLDWLSIQGNKGIQDDEVARGERLRGFGWVSPVVLIVLTALVVFLAYKTNSRGM